MINDISRAFFCARVKRTVYVQLPREDQAPGEENMCGRFKCRMHGTRDAVQIWYQEYSQQLVDIGFKPGAASPRIFYHKEKGIRTYVHGGNYVSSGAPESLQLMQQKLDAKYHVKT